MIRAELQTKIAVICAEIDARDGKQLGTTERALYWAYWPPSRTTSIENLVFLLNDARDWLAKAPATAATSCP